MATKEASISEFDKAILSRHIKCPCCGDNNNVVGHCPDKRCPAKWLKCRKCRAIISFIGFDGEVLDKPRHSNHTHNKNCRQI